MSHFFEIGKDLEVFHTKEELLNKINYYLRNEEERKQIAKQGQMTFRRLYEYKIYSPKFINEINSYRNHKNIVQHYSWPSIIKKFNTRFLNINKFYNIKYIFMAIKYFDLFFFSKQILLKLIKRNYI